MTSSLIQTPGTLRPLVRLSLPVLLEQVLHLGVGFSDLFLTGRFLEGNAYVAAMSLVIYLAWLINMQFAFVSTGATPLTARFTGAGDHELANKVMNQSLGIGFAWAAGMMVVGFVGASALVNAMGLEGQSAEAAVRYLHIVLLVLPAIMVELVGVACLRGAGDTVSGLGVMVVVNVVNVGLSYTLVTGAGGWFEPLGWDGICLGTAAGHVTGATILLALLAGGRAGYCLRLRRMVPEWRTVKRILRIGVPGGFDSVLIVVCNLIYLRIVLQLGDTAAAAHGVAIQVEALAFMPGGAFQIAAATMTGQYLGAGDPHRATRSALVATGAASAMMFVAGLLFWFQAEWLVGLFLDDKPGVAPLAAQLLRLISTAMLPLAVSMVLAGALRGAGDTRWPLLITLIGFGLVRIPLAAYCAQESVTLPLVGLTVSGLGLGAVGAWYGAVADLCTRAVLMTGRFWQGGWRRIAV